MVAMSPASFVFSPEAASNYRDHYRLVVHLKDTIVAKVSLILPKEKYFR